MTQIARASAPRRIDEFAIRPADARLLGALLDFHFLTPDQLTRLLFADGSATHVYAKLNRLARGKHVQAIPMPRPQLRGASRLVYTLDRSGLAHLRELGVAIPDGFRIHAPRNHSYLFLDHQVAVADVLIAAALLERQAPRISLRGFVHDRELARAPIAVALPDGEALKLAPDAFLSFDAALRHGRGRFHILWEVDRGTVDRQAWRMRVRGYLAGLDDGGLAAAFGVAMLSVAVSVPDRRRQAELLTLIGSVAEEARRPDLASLFTVTAEDPARTRSETLFLSPVFALPLTGELVPLLEHEELERLIFLAGKGGA